MLVKITMLDIYIDGHYSATWNSLISPRFILSLVHLSTTCTYMDLPLGCQLYMPRHRTDDMWHFFIGPHGPQKIPFPGDTWKPIVLPHYHFDRMLGILWACHVAPLWLLTFLTTTLTNHNFFTQTPFETIFALLESSHQGLHNQVIFKIIWEYQFFYHFGSSQITFECSRSS